MICVKNKMWGLYGEDRNVIETILLIIEIDLLL